MIKLEDDILELEGIEEYRRKRCDTYKLLIDQITPHFYDERFDF